MVPAGEGPSGPMDGGYGRHRTSHTSFAPFHTHFAVLQMTRGRLSSRPPGALDWAVAEFALRA
jgi:hypothetical protein